MKDCRRVVEPTRSGDLRKPQNGRDGIAGKWRKRRAELAIFHVKRDFGGTGSVVRETSKYGLRATEDLHPLRFAPVNSFANEAEYLHGARWKKWSLVRSDLHKVSSPRNSHCRF
jgi:hypothetical protein